MVVIGEETRKHFFPGLSPIGREIRIGRVPYTVIGKIRKKNQDSNYSGPDNNKVFIPFSVMAQDLPRLDAPPGTVSQIVLAPHPWVVDLLPQVLASRTGRIEDVRWPFDGEVRRILGKRHDFSPLDPDAVGIWDTSLETLMFGRMVGAMKDFFTVVGIVTLALICLWGAMRMGFGKRA